MHVNVCKPKRYACVFMPFPPFYTPPPAMQHRREPEFHIFSKEETKKRVGSIREISNNDVSFLLRFLFPVSRTRTHTHTQRPIMVSMMTSLEIPFFQRPFPSQMFCVGGAISLHVKPNGRAQQHCINCTFDI